MQQLPHVFWHICGHNLPETMKMLWDWPGLQAVQYDISYYSQHISWPEWFESVDSFKSPFVRVHFDTGNIMPFQFPEHWSRSWSRGSRTST